LFAKKRGWHVGLFHLTRQPPEEEHHFIQKVVGAMAVLAERLEQAETVDAKKLQRVMDFIRTFAENGPWICPQSIRHLKRSSFEGRAEWKNP
jgi:hypothetical protein